MQRTPQRAWLIGAQAPGVADDIRALRTLLEEELHPTLQHTVHHVLHAQLGAPAIQAQIDLAFEEMARFTGRLFVWIGGHGRPETGSPIVHLHTDGPAGERVTLYRIWKTLDHLAANRSEPVVAILDLCHAGPPRLLDTRRLHSNLVVIAAAHTDEAARGVDGQGGWLTSAIVDALRTAEGHFDVNALRARLRDVQIDEDHGFQTPEIHASTLQERLVLNRAEAADPRPARDDGEALWREHLRQAHRELIPFYDDDAPEVLSRVYVEVDVAVGPEAMRASHRLRGLLLQQPGSRWALVGQPGAGKTTLVRHLAWELGTESEGPLPVYVSLAAVAASRRDPIAEALHEAFGVDTEEASAVRRSLEARRPASGGLWIFLDGLDEVPPERVKRLRTDLKRWLAAWPNATWVLSSRPEASPDALGFQRAEVQPLGARAQAELLTRWFEGDAVRAEAVRTHCLDHDLGDLLENPLLLTLVAYLAKSGRPPMAQGSLYDDAVSLLLKRGHCRDRRGVAHPEAARQILAPLSLRLHETGVEVWPRDDIAQHLEAVLAAPELAARLGRYWPAEDRRPAETRFLDDVGRNGGLLRPHDGPRAPWRYLHRSLRELLTAEALLADDAKRAEVRAAVKKDRKHAARWGNTLVLACGRSKAPLAELKALRAASTELALRALADATQVPGDEAFDFLVGTKGWDGDDLLRLARRWPADAAEGRILSLVRPDIGIEELAFVLYALEGIDRPPKNRATFFADAGRPLVTPPFSWEKIPAGDFLMGSPDGVGEDRERPQRRVTLAAFELMATPVTNAHYAAFEPRHRRDARPVVSVSWWAAWLFARWAGGALPTEAQWEYACRAGTTTAWSCGDDAAGLGEYAWYDENAKSTQPVGTKEANAWGLHDMHGNVWEWCWDWFADRYPAGPAEDPRGPSSGRRRVRRGGSCWNSAVGCRSAYRIGSTPGYRDLNLGFRLARSPRRPPSR